MTLALNVLCTCLIFIASTDGWIFRIKLCTVSGWPSNWEHGSAGPVYDTEIYRCSVAVEPSGNLTDLVAIVGNHLEGKTNSDIQLIDINNSSTFTSIPSNIGNLLPHLIGIDFRAELITAVTAEDLKQFPNLTYLAISVGLIVSLDKDLLKYTPHIQVLIVPSNKIVSVGENLLANLENLKFVNFLSNPCLSYYASNHQQLEWLKSNLPLRCPPIATTTATATRPPTPPTAPKPASSTYTSTSKTTSTSTQTNPTPTLTNPTPTLSNPTSTTTIPVDECQIRCSLNEETDELKDELIYQGTLIRDLYGIMSDYSHRIFELEKINAKILRAAKVFSCLVYVEQ